MLIWLGKQWLKQSDKVEFTGESENVVEIHSYDINKLSKEDLMKLKEISIKAHVGRTTKYKTDKKTARKDTSPGTEESQ